MNGPPVALITGASGDLGRAIAVRLGGWSATKYLSDEALNAVRVGDGDESTMSTSG